MANEGKFPKQDGDIYYGLDANATYYNAALSTTGSYNGLTVGSDVTTIVASASTRKKILIRNTGDYTVYIGGSSVTTTTGTPVDSNVCIVLNTDDAIYGITTGSDTDIRYLEVL